MRGKNNLIKIQMIQMGRIDKKTSLQKRGQRVKEPIYREIIEEITKKPIWACRLPAYKLLLANAEQRSPVCFVLFTELCISIGGTLPERQQCQSNSELINTNSDCWCCQGWLPALMQLEIQKRVSWFLGLKWWLIILFVWIWRESLWFKVPTQGY